MKPTLLTGFLFLFMGTIANAQLSFLPYAGFEQNRSTLNYNDAFSAANINGNLKAGLRMDYRLKGGHSPFINLATSPAPAVFHFDENGSLFNVTKSNQLFRFEAGYMYSSKAIQFAKTNKPAKAPVTESTVVPQRRSCGSSTYRSHCGMRRSVAKTLPPQNNLSMRLQPSLALAYLPAAKQNVEQTASGFEYTAGWKTALVPAMGFQFDKGRQRLFTLNVFYTKPLAQKNEMVNTFENGKPVTTTLQPSTSTWGITLGVPFSFAKAKETRIQTTEKKECTHTYHRRCYYMQ